MDKPQKNNSTIKIKFNGKESPYTEDREKQEEEEQKQEIPDSRESLNKEAAAAKESEESSDTFQWILPDQENSPEMKEYNLFPVEDQKKIPLKKKPVFSKSFHVKDLKNANLTMFLSIFFAVLLGTFFGLMLLKVVPAEKVVDNTQPVTNPVQEKESLPPATAGNGKTEGVLAAMTTAVVQEGIYSTKEGAQEKKEALAQKGIPSEVFPFNSQFALFVGIADNVTDAKTIGNRYTSSGIETYSKELTVNEKTIPNLEEEEKKLLQLSPAIFQSFLEKNDIEEHASHLAGIDKKKLKNETILDMYNQLEAASTQAKLYEKDPTTKTDQNLQQHLLTFLAQYQALSQS